jgi:hypothetical protein
VHDLERDLRDRAVLAQAVGQRHRLAEAEVDGAERPALCARVLDDPAQALSLLRRASLRSELVPGATIEDPHGRAVVLSVERWAHIIDGHPELEPHEEDVLRAVRAPTQTTPGREPGEQWYYLAGAGPSRWLKVVVLFDQPLEGRIITAFPRRRKL